MNRFWLVSYGYQDTWLNTMHKSGLAFSTEYWGDFQSRNNLLSRFFLPPLQWAVDKGLNGRNRIVFMTSVSARKITKAQRILLLVFFFSFFPLFAWRDELLVCGGSTFPLVYSKVRMWHWLLAVRTRSTKFRQTKKAHILFNSSWCTIQEEATRQDVSEGYLKCTEGNNMCISPPSHKHAEIDNGFLNVFLV